MLLDWRLTRLAAGLSEPRLRFRGGCQKRRSCRPSWAALAVGLEATRLRASSTNFSLFISSNGQGQLQDVLRC